MKPTCDATQGCGNISVLMDPKTLILYNSRFTQPT